MKLGSVTNTEIKFPQCPGKLGSQEVKRCSKVAIIAISKIN